MTEANKNGLIYFSTLDLQQRIEVLDTFLGKWMTLYYAGQLDEANDYPPEGPIGPLSKTAEGWYRLTWTNYQSLYSDTPEVPEEQFRDFEPTDVFLVSADGRTIVLDDADTYVGVQEDAAWDDEGQLVLTVWNEDGQPVEMTIHPDVPADVLKEYIFFYMKPEGIMIRRMPPPAPTTETLVEEEIPF